MSSGRLYATTNFDLILYNGTNRFAKIDTNGNVLWTKQIGQYTSGNIFKAKKANRFFSKTTTDNNFILGYYDDDLNLVKQAAFPLKGTYSYSETKDSGYIVFVNANPSLTNTRKLSVMYLDMDLNTQWTYNETAGYARVDCFTEDATAIYLGGQQHRYNESTGIITGADGYMVKLDKATGAVVWTKNFNVPEGTIVDVSQIEVLPGGHLSLIAPAQTGLSTFQVLLELDAAGNVLSHTSRSNPRVVYETDTIKVTTATGVLKVTNEKVSGEEKIVSTMYSTTGLQLWKHYYSATGSQRANSAIVAPSGSIFISGAAIYYDGINYTTASKLCLIKTDKNGETCY